MNLEYFKTDPVSHLVRELFYLSFEMEDIPFSTKIIPIGCPSLTYIYGKKQTAYFGSAQMPLKKLTLTGQFDSAYKMEVKEEGSSFGINFHPSGLYKLTQTDNSHYTNKHQNIDSSEHQLFRELERIFVRHASDMSVLAQEITLLLSESDIYHDDKVQAIDHAIDFIEENKGMISVNDLVKELSFSQKTLEVHFKRIVGVTPGRFIRLHRFTNLMRKYESHEIDIKDLFTMYDYYDRSHFAKDFKLFIKESPKSYFKKDFPLIKKYLKEN